MEKTNFLQAAPGNNSNSRLIVLIIIIFALIETLLVLWFGREDVVQAATAAGVLFITIAGPAMAFIFAQKKTETAK